MKASVSGVDTGEVVDNSDIDVARQHGEKLWQDAMPYHTAYDMI